jgi:hypothetical protein
VGAVAACARKRARRSLRSSEEMFERGESVTTGEDPRTGEQPLTDDELRALDVDVLDAREVMSTLLVAPAPGVTPQVVGAIEDVELS